MAAELVHSKGKAAVEELQMTVEREWLQLKAIRRRFNGGSSPVMVRHHPRDYLNTMYGQCCYRDTVH